MRVTAAKFIKQCSFTWMLILSAAMIYIVSFVGVKNGKLKNDISWTQPVFVALFNNDVNDGRTEAFNEPVEVIIKDGKLDRLADAGTMAGDGQSTGENSSTEVIDKDNNGGEPVTDVPQKETEAGSEGVNIGEENGINSEYNIESAYSGQVEFVKVDMRHARSGYYSDFDTIALTSKLDYINVDNDYFSNACFIGDSRMEGLYFYGDLKEADFVYKPGVTVYDIMNNKLSMNGGGSYRLTDVLAKKQYAQIYMMVGVNELGDKNPDEYAKAYSNDIEIIRQLQPDAVIFIIGMMHVTTQYSDSSDVFNNDNIDARNTAAAAIANGRDIFYLDMNECVDDGAGGVIGDYSYDGVHLKAEYYKLWTEWMKAHGIKNLIK